MKEKYRQLETFLHLIMLKHYSVSLVW